jgi:hypothetical protein
MILCKIEVLKFNVQICVFHNNHSLGIFWIENKIIENQGN